MATDWSLIDCLRIQKIYREKLSFEAVREYYSASDSDLCDALYKAAWWEHNPVKNKLKRKFNRPAKERKQNQVSKLMLTFYNRRGYKMYAYRLRQEGMAFAKIGDVMGLSTETIRQMCAWVERSIRDKRKQPYTIDRDVYKEFKEHYDEVMNEKRI